MAKKGDDETTKKPATKKAGKAAAEAAGSTPAKKKAAKGADEAATTTGAAEAKPKKARGKAAATPEAPVTQADVTKAKAPEAEAAPEAAPHTEGDITSAIRGAAAKVLHDKLGVDLGPEGQVDLKSIPIDKIQANTKEFVTSLFSAVGSKFSDGLRIPTGDAQSAGGAEGAQDDGNVIDLGAARQKKEQARAKVSELEQRLSGSIKGAFNDYLRRNVVEPGQTGSATVQLDNTFLKEHGPKLLASMFGALANAFIPKEVAVPEAPAPGAGETGAEAPAGEPKADAEGAKTAGEEPVKVTLNIDLPGLFRSLVKTPGDPGSDKP